MVTDSTLLSTIGDRDERLKSVTSGGTMFERKDMPSGVHDYRLLQAGHALGLRREYFFFLHCGRIMMLHLDCILSSAVFYVFILIHHFAFSLIGRHLIHRASHCEPQGQGDYSRFL